jgi:hypothetical protein
MSATRSLVFTPPSGYVNSNNMHNLLFRATVKVMSLALRNEQTLRLLKNILQKKSFESKGRMKEKAEKKTE